MLRLKKSFRDVLVVETLERRKEMKLEDFGSWFFHPSERKRIRNRTLLGDLQTVHTNSPHFGRSLNARIAWIL